MIAARQIAFGSGKRKPYDAEIEYLESTGTQHIDTGIRATPDSVIRCTLTPVSYINNGMVFWGAGKADGENGYGDMVELVDQYGRREHIVFVATGRATNGIPFTYGDTIDTVSVCSTGALIAGGTTVITANRLLQSTAQYPIYIGCANIAGKRFRGANCRYHAFSIEQSGKKIIDLIPVRKGDIGYMYDKVSGKLFGNAGTGAFVLGSDAVSVNGGGYNRKCVRRSYRRSWRASTRFSPRHLWKEVA